MMKLTLERFRSAHAESYETALREIRSGRKQSHWIWFIFPQIQGPGHSMESMYYAIQDREEAVAYWEDPVLSEHLVTLCQELLKLDDPIGRIMGYPDNLKLRSCMTLFYQVSHEPVFKRVLDKFYGGEQDEYTIRKLGQ